jgi:predicted nucleic acid-binding protein
VYVLLRAHRLLAIASGIAYDTVMPAHPTIVLDTNVLESAVRSRLGASYALVSLVGTGRFDIAISVPLVLEYEEVLMRQVSEMRRSQRAARDLIDYFCAVGKRQRIFFLWRPCLPDPRDDMVLEVAVAAGCDAIVTHNGRHFHPAPQFGVRVQSPAEFLREMEDDE